ncbi:MAG TPA: hypothetical protein VLH40_02430 [Atribacteraceae bacterium]|nr:hypothetical protein [Atribacteraceae bacterium]
MRESPVTSTGKLRKKFLPALYFDTSLLIEYWLTEGMERPQNELDLLFRKNENPVYSVIQELIDSERHLSQVVEIRKKILSGQLSATPVVSPLALLELMEWHAQAAFHQITADAPSVLSLQNKGKKDIGNCLKRVLERHKIEMHDAPDKRRAQNTGTAVFIDETWLDFAYANNHGLIGLLQADIVQFRLTVKRSWGLPSLFSYLQLNLADTLHLLLAHHLGCQYLASFDSDFVRVRDIVLEEMGIRILATPEEMLGVL